MIDRKRMITELAQQVPDSYSDFVNALPVFARMDGLEDEIIEYMRENKEAKSDDILIALNIMAGRYAYEDSGSDASDAGNA